MGKDAFWVGVLVIVTACGSSRPPRVVDGLTGFDGLVVSNSPAALATPEPSMTRAGLSVDYPLLLENAGQREVSIELGAASFRIGTERGEASCRAGSARPRVLLLRPGERWRIDCNLVLPHQRLGVLLEGDADGQLSIPIRSKTGQAELRFAYSLRVEDAT